MFAVTFQEEREVIFEIAEDIQRSKTFHVEFVKNCYPAVGCVLHKIYFNSGLISDINSYLT